MIKNVLLIPDGTEIGSGIGTQVAILSTKLTDAVNADSELSMGSAFANIMEMSIITPGGSLQLTAGDEVTLFRVSDDGTRTKKGIYILEKPTRPAANTIKLTGYDRTIKLDKDLTVWLQGLTGWPYKLIDFASMVCNACGLSLVTETIPNGDFPVNQFVASGVTGRQLMRWIGEISCRFCRANADGDMELAWYEPSGKSITPAGNHRYFAKSLTYDTYQVAPVDAVQIRMADSTSGALWPPTLYGTVTVDTLNIRNGAGTGYDQVGTLKKGDRVQILSRKTISGGTVWGQINRGWVCITGYMTLETTAADNPYIISGNAILLARVTEDLIPYLQVIKEELSGMTYTPCKVSIPATIDIRPGQTVNVTDANGVTITVPVMKKTTSGQRETLECTGSAKRSSSTAANNKTNAQTAQDMLANQTHQDIFNKLTKNGEIQGIYVQDGKWYINAELAKIVNIVASSIVSGLLSSKDGKTKFNLDTGEVLCTGDDGSSIRFIGGIFNCAGQYGSKIEMRNGTIKMSLNDKSTVHLLSNVLGSGGLMIFPSGEHISTGGESFYGLYMNKDELYAYLRDLDDTDDGQWIISRKIGFKEINGVKHVVAYD